MMPDYQSNARAQQESLEALVASKKLGPDAGLALLQGKTDPDSTRRKLVILLQAGRVSEAAKVIRGQQPDEMWADLAIHALSKNGEIEEAERFFSDSRRFQNRAKRVRCMLSLAVGLFENAFHSQRERGEDACCKWFGRSGLVRVKEVLIPILTPIEAVGRIETEFDQEVVELALKTFHFLGEKAGCARMAKILSKREPVSLVLGEAVLGGWVENVAKDLPERLRRDHAELFDAKLMAAALEGYYSPGAALTAAEQIIPKAETRDQRFRLWKLIEALAERAGGEAQTSVAKHLPGLLSNDEILSSFMAAEGLIQAGRLSEAKEILEKVRSEDNLYWLQIWGDVSLQSGDVELGLSAFKQAARLYPNPDLFGRAAEIAFNCNKLDEAAELIEQQLCLDPDNVRARVRLAFVFLEMENHEKAADEFAELHRRQPDEPAHLVNQALSLQLLGKVEQSLEILESLCSAKSPPVQAIVIHAGILKAKNMAEAGFAGLKKVRDQYWHDPGFVGAFMDLAHAAQEDRAAHEALLRLQELQEQGKFQDVLRMVSFDEIKGHLQEFQTKKEELLRLSLEGKVPWLLVERFLGRVPHWGWYLRTQALPWLNEAPLVLAEHSIYSTNSFSIQKADSGNCTLEDIRCPPEGTSVVIDLSALITLNQLGLLDQAARYFGKLLIPSSYAARVLEESSRLVVHQKSQRTSLQKVRLALDTMKIKIQGTENTGGAPLPHVHEHSLETEQGHFYRLRDIADVLRHEGQISNPEYKELLTAAHKPSGVDSEHPALRIAQTILVDLSTLATFHTLNLLDRVISLFDVHISASDREEVLRGIRGFEAYEGVYRSHTEMWEKIRSDKRFILIPRKFVMGPKKGEEETDREIYFSAFQLAREQKLPLLADDRTSQVIASNEPQALEYPALSTDKLLPALAQAGLLTHDELADAFLQLISWRYRFIVTPSQVLWTLARRYLSNPPGKQLRDIARYVHSCMRDPGLFAGFERTDPPTTMATRLFYKWACVAAELIVEAWSDSSVAEEDADAITRWVVRELLPSPPKTMAYPASELLASLLPRITLAHALICSGKIGDHKRANRGLLSISSAMGVSPTDYFRYFTETIDGIRD